MQLLVPAFCCLACMHLLAWVQNQKNAEATTEDVASESVEIYDPIRAYLDRYGGSLYNEYGDAVITAVRPIGGNTDGYKAYVIKEVPPFEETE